MKNSKTLKFMNHGKIISKTIGASIPFIFRNSLHLIEAVAANVYFNFPGKKLKIIGVTGTDGKTTTSFFIYSILKATGKKTALISTVGAKIGGQDIDTGFHVTTPDSWELQKFIKRIADEGNEYLVLEVTSHGLDQHRVFGIPFEVGVLTNITHEHLDYHRTFENYLKSKAKLFEKAKISILNKDDPSFERLSKVAKEFFWYSRQKSVGLAPSGNLRGLCRNLGGLDESELRKQGIQIKLLGDYNWSNALAAALAARSLDIGWEAIKAGIEAVSFIPGRMEEIANNKGFRIFVDFAHTPNGLDKSLPTARQMAGQGRVIVVFGCAGLRDKEKRPLMGEIAARLADISILTAEDPRIEDVNDIIGQIVQGSIKGGAKENHSENLEELKNSAARVFVRIPDRKKAVELALQVAKNGDCVIITGKGHERSMCYGETEYPWNDQEVVKDFLQE